MSGAAPCLMATEQTQQLAPTTERIQSFESAATSQTGSALTQSYGLSSDFFLPLN